jgi:FdhD protein
MRTPGADFELAAGFLYGEGIIRSGPEIRGISHCEEPDLDEDKRYNIVNVELHGHVLPDLQALERHFYTTSACGVCGKASLESLRIRGCPSIAPGPVVDADVIRRLQEALREGQSVFAATGGLHAAALFDLHGDRLAVREDVGRHNALDKLVGWALLGGTLPLSRHIVMVSGRSSCWTGRRDPSSMQWFASIRRSAQTHSDASAFTGRSGTTELLERKWRPHEVARHVLDGLLVLERDRLADV